MAASVPPNPRLGKSQALNIGQANTQRITNLIPNVATELSPVTIYQPSSSFTFGATPGNPPVTVQDSYGVWVAPDLNGDGSIWYATVECFGGGGGGGGGNATQGGGGGGGGEYAREDQYPITPGASYVYVVGLAGVGGLNNGSSSVNPGSAGANGGLTIFDIQGLGLAGGVVANGGQGGDATSIGVGGNGGSGSVNTVHFNGGNGGNNTGGSGSDNPVDLAQASGMFVGNTLNTNIIKTWHIMNDSNFSSATRNDATGNGKTATWTNFSGSFITAELNPAAPAQVPAYTAAAGVYGPNQTTAGWTSLFNPKSVTTPAARLDANVPGFGGTRITVSGWIQAPSIGTWGNTATSSFAVIASNSTNINFASFKGYALYLFKVNSTTWQLYAQVGNGTTRYTINSGSIPPTPGTWYYVVMTYNSGLLSLYVNGSLVSSTTTTGYTSVPGGAFGSEMGMDPSTSTNWFFGAVSNFWWAFDCLTATGVSQAFGVTAPTGGAGGGASGGPSANGGNGSSGAGATGGAGGTPATQPASLQAYTTQAMGGFSGSNANSTNGSPLTPAGGPYGGGGGACGDMTSPPTLQTLVIPFQSAASYAGVDAAVGPGTPYNVGQQARPAAGLNTLLYAGGQASDIASGSKNTVLLLPAGLNKMLGGALGTYTIENIYLTLTNANPNNAVNTILEVGYSTTDTVLPQTYNGASLVDYIGAIPIEIGSGTITYDLAPSGFATQLTGQGGGSIATALILGPGANPTFDAFNSPTGPEFYASIYGPGAYDTFGNPLYPYLTITYQKTLTIQTGSDAATGAIVINQTSNSIPVAFVEPFSGSDAAGNQFAQGFTGPINTFDPSVLSPGLFKPEIWHTPSITLSGWAQTSGNMLLRYRLLPTGDLQLCGDIGGPAIVGNPTLFTLPSAYFTTHIMGFTICRFAGTLSATDDGIGQVSAAGAVQVFGCAGATRLIFNAVIPLSAT